VLVADAESSGQFQKASTLGTQLAGVIEGNPEAMDSHQLHDATYRVMRQRLDTGRSTGHHGH
jgi:hypothetical protein